MKGPSLLTLARRTMRDILASRADGAAGEKTRVLVAVSGGGDSTALLHVLSLLRKTLPLELVAVGIDHGLRREAAAELERAKGLAGGWDVPFEIKKVELGSTKSNLQARARQARHAALERAMQRHLCHFVATAHHADDRAETVLIRLLSGATAEGLAVLPPRDGVRIRPLIHARKTDVLAHLERNGIPYANDPSNLDPRFLRVRIRRELMPLLTEFDTNIVMHLSQLSDELGRRSPSPGRGQPEPEALAGAHADRSLRELLASLKHPIPKAARIALENLPKKHPRAEVALHGGLVVRFDRTHTVYIASKSPRARPQAPLRAPSKG